jgi:ABC-type nitrate/sulfonate/bicarbonate transport system substrate-binding protein
MQACRRATAGLFTVLACLTIVLSAAQAQPSTIRVGHFPNITHVQALVAHHLSRQGKGWFEERLGPGVKIDWFVYNAGPSAMEAIFANSIDLTYVGPNPAINAYAKSRGAEIRIVAGAASGGAALVVQPDSRLKVAADFRGKKLATPQLGNTQEVDAVTTVLATGVKFLGANRETLRKFVAAHQELTEWIKTNPAEAQRMVREEFAAETRTSMPAELVERAWKRIVVTSTVSREELDKFMANAQSVGFLRDAPDLSRLIERP